jgi:hypothetical protein
LDGVCCDGDNKLTVSMRRLEADDDGSAERERLMRTFHGVCFGHGTCPADGGGGGDTRCRLGEGVSSSVKSRRRRV